MLTGLLHQLTAAELCAMQTLPICRADSELANQMYDPPCTQICSRLSTRFCNQYVHQIVYSIFNTKEYVGSNL